MTTSMLPFGKVIVRGNASLTHCIPSRNYSNAAITVATNGNGKHAQRAEDPTLHRDLFMNVLEASATKRDAKQYLARFQPSKKTAQVPSKLSAAQEERNAIHRRDQDRLDRMGVNLGGLYAPARSIAEAPQFMQQSSRHDTLQVQHDEFLHIALVFLKDAETLDDTTVDGLAITLSQLVRLDMRILMVLDSSHLHRQDQSATGLLPNPRELRNRYAKQAHRIAHAVAMHNPASGRYISGALELVEEHESDDRCTSQLRVAVPKVILEPLQRGVIPIIPPLAFSATGKLTQVDAGDIMAALTAEFGKAPDAGVATDDPAIETSLDRIIVLDPIGGIPSKDRGDGSHVFINLEQEFDDIEQELSEYAAAALPGTPDFGRDAIYERHRNNLEMLQRCLSLLPSASSAVIITPQEAANSSQSGRPLTPPIAAGTRRQKNTLIHNLLTNRPRVSSSLPVARLSASEKNTSEGAITRSIRAPTLIKRGMPLTIIPAADRVSGWQRPTNGVTSLRLDQDPRIDFPRLVHLINNSFRRQLDVQDYLARIQGRIAGIIVAGEYEGGAILTWEMPPGTSDPSRLVPYLDKFAVLQSSQGSSGVADIVFQAMVRSCFPRGVCWRSRKDNPVNKWYFERSSASWQIPNTNWTMFWTGEGVVENEQRWNDYVGVCESVQPTWLDNARPD